MKKQYQSVNFKNIEEFLEYLPPDELKIVNLLRSLIFECMPQCTEKLNYNVPFYRIINPACFIWPASVKWGEKVSYEGVRLGFNRGYLMQDEINYLEKGNRKQVYWKTFHSANEIDIVLVKTYLYEAAAIDNINKI